MISTAEKTEMTVRNVCKGMQDEKSTAISLQVNLIAECALCVSETSHNGKDDNFAEQMQRLVWLQKIYRVFKDGIKGLNTTVPFEMPKAV